MIGVFLTPIATNAAGQRDPTCLVASKGLAGRKRAHMLSRDDINIGLFVCEADDFTAVNAVANVVQLANVAKFADAHDSLLNYTTTFTAQQRTAIASRLATAGIDSTGITTVGDLIRRIALRFEPASYPDMFDSPTPNKTGTITDDFLGTGTMGAGWTTAILGAGSFARVSDQAIGSPGSDTTAIRRTETLFPANQWAQCDIEANATGERGQVIVRASAGPSATFYCADIDTTTINVRRTTTYLTDFLSTNTAGTLFTVKIDVTGTTITIFRNAVSQGSTTDSNLTSGKPGLAVFGNIPNNIPFDNFQCIDALAAGGTAYITRDGVIRRTV